MSAASRAALPPFNPRRDLLPAVAARNRASSAVRGSLT